LKRKTTLLKEYVLDEETLVMPGAYDALSARIAEKIGFKVVGVGGFSLTATILGKPDVSLLTMTEMVNRVHDIADAVDLPLFADAETGYGNIINVRRTVQELERAGAAGLFIEDQVFPARCGLMEGIEVVPVEEMVAKIKAAVDARVDPDLVIMARTDARKVYGLDEAISRSNIYREAGADMIFAVTPNRTEELERVAREVDAPKMAVIGEDGSPAPTVQAVAEMGYDVVFFPLSAIFSAAKSVWRTMQTLYETGSTTQRLDNMMSFQEFTNLVGLEEIIELQSQSHVKSRGEG
jgi:2-methylisocitrate lyase-like PEP mutase family enzyme